MTIDEVLEQFPVTREQVKGARVRCPEPEPARARTAGGDFPTPALRALAALAPRPRLGHFILFKRFLSVPANGRREMFKTPTLRIGVLPAVLATGLMMSACGTTPGDRIVSGGVLGAGAGAAIGSLSGNAGKGAIIGGVAGGTLGALSTPPYPGYGYYDYPRYSYSYGYSRYPYYRYGYTCYQRDYYG